MLSSEEEQDQLRRLIHQTVLKPCSSEVSLTMLLKFGGSYAREPLLHVLPNLQAKVSLFFDVNEQRDKQAVEEMLEGGGLRNGSGVRVGNIGKRNSILEDPHELVAWAYYEIFGDL